MRPPELAGTDVDLRVRTSWEENGDKKKTGGDAGGSCKVGASTAGQDHECRSRSCPGRNHSRGPGDAESEWERRRGREDESDRREGLGISERRGKRSH